MLRTNVETFPSSVQIAQLLQATKKNHSHQLAMLVNVNARPRTRSTTPSAYGKSASKHAGRSSQNVRLWFCIQLFNPLRLLKELLLVFLVAELAIRVRKLSQCNCHVT